MRWKKKKGGEKYAWHYANELRHCEELIQTLQRKLDAIEQSSSVQSNDGDKQTDPKTQVTNSKQNEDNGDNPVTASKNDDEEEESENSSEDGGFRMI